MPPCASSVAAASVGQTHNARREAGVVEVSAANESGSVNSVFSAKIRGQRTDRRAFFQPRCQWASRPPAFLLESRRSGGKELRSKSGLVPVWASLRLTQTNNGNEHGKGERMKAQRFFLLLLLVALLTLGMTCNGDDDDDNDNDDVDDDNDDESPDDDDESPDDDDDNDDNDVDDDDDDDNTPADCPPITEQEATRFYWPNQPPIMGGQTMVIGVTLQGHHIIAPAGIIAINGLKTDQYQWTLIDGDELPLGYYDLTIPEGGTIEDGNPNMYVSMIYGATLQGTYDEWWISVSGCAEIAQTGWVGDKFTGYLDNVVFRRLLSDTTGEIDWVGPDMGFNGAWDVVNKTIISQ
jgi:hypothetical protein